MVVLSRLHLLLGFSHHVSAFLHHHHPTTSPVMGRPLRQHLSSSTLFSSRATDTFVKVTDTDGQPRRVHVLTTPPLADYNLPPLVLIGGTAQVINSWIGQLQPLAKQRQVVVYEARGQGKTELLLDNVTLHQHVADLCSVIEALGLSTPIDLVGFSFGGRVCMAAAGDHPDLVRRVVATGVSADREALGRLIIQSWRSSLERGNFLDFAWSSILHSHGRAFLSKFESKIPSWVDLVVQGNSAEGLLAILTQSHHTDDSHPYHMANVVKRLRCPCLLIGGEEDRLAPEGEVRKLAVVSKPPLPVKIIPQVGHNSVFEEPKLWRDYVLDFLQRPEEEDYVVACRGQPDEY